MGNFFNYNGKIFTEATPVIGADSRGLRYGDGLFETMKIKNGQILYANEHFARLWKGLKVLQFDIPKHFTPELLEEQILAVAQKNKHTEHARVRLNIIRGNGGLYDPENLSPNYIIQTWPLSETIGQWNSNGLILDIYTDAQKNCDILSNLKHNNYLVYAMAALFAKQQKCNDAIVLNNFGRVCDATIANIFIVTNNSIFTPALSEGCVEGIMRKNIIDVLKNTETPVTQSAITQEELLVADEIFITNAIQQIRWVKSIGNKNFNNSITQKIYSLLNSTI